MGFKIGNKFSLGLTNNGRPPKFETVEEITVKINEYFESLSNENKDGYKQRPTITGLSLFLGFDSRKSFYNYSAKDDFLHIIKRAQQVVEMSYEEMLLSSNSTGAIFALKNMGWVDKMETTNFNVNTERKAIEFVNKSSNKIDE